MRTLYDVLNVSPSSPTSEIKRAFYRLALIYHPDKNTNPDASKKFRTIFYAYQVLTDQEARARYDQKLLNNNFAKTHHRGAYENSTSKNTSEDVSPPKSSESGVSKNFSDVISTYLTFVFSTFQDITTGIFVFLRKDFIFQLNRLQQNANRLKLTISVKLARGRKKIFGWFMAPVKVFQNYFHGCQLTIKKIFLYFRSQPCRMQRYANRLKLTISVKLARERKKIFGWFMAPVKVSQNYFHGCQLTIKKMFLYFRSQPSRMQQYVNRLKLTISVKLAGGRKKIFGWFMAPVKIFQEFFNKCQLAIKRSFLRLVSLGKFPKSHLNRPQRRI